MRANATVLLDFPSEKHAEIVFRALAPEIEVSVTSRSKVHVVRKGNCLTLSFETRDTSALRAAINSYLRFIQLAKAVTETIEKECLT